MRHGMYWSGDLAYRDADGWRPLSAPRRFNLMFKTFMGPVEEDASVIYLRPETAQGSYVNFKNVLQSSRKKLPFGIAQIGKSFRNEISPGNFVFRMREFEQMEMQYFVRPEAEAAAAFEMWLPSAPRLVRALRRHARHACASASTPPTSSPTTPRRRSTSNTASRSAGRSSRASTTAATSTCRATPRRRGENARVLRPGDQRARHPVDRRDGRRRGPGGVHVPDRRLSRGGGPRRDAGLARAPSGPRAVQGRGAAAAQEATRDRRAVPQDQGRPQAPHDGRLRRHGRDRQALSPAGRDRDAVVRHGRRRLARGRRGDRARPRLDDPGARAGRGRDAARSSIGSRRRAPGRGAATPGRSAPFLPKDRPHEHKTRSHRARWLRPASSCSARAWPAAVFARRLHLDASRRLYPLPACRVVT